MSTSGKCDDGGPPEGGRSGVSPWGRAGPDDFADLRAVVCVRPQRREFAVKALVCPRENVVVLERAGELLQAEADLVVLDHASLQALGPQQRCALLRRWQERLDPIRVVIDVPLKSRVGLQIGGGVDLAVEPEIAPRELSARLGAFLRRALVERDRNPLTRLPGNRWLRRYLRERLREQGSVGLLLLDIDDFKRYNDERGQLCGDEAIRALGGIAAQSAESCHEGLAAHIGGDDFCIVCPPEALDGLAKACIASFERAARALDGEGLLTITLVATVVVPGEAPELEEVFARLARLKAEGKGRPGNSYLREERPA
ncbi:MAG: diguanylate cyclase [Armatimonadota bacterium]